MAEWHVLLVEDTADSAEVVELILTHHNIPHTTARSAEEALELLATLQPTMILVDLALPGMSGWELLKVLRERPATRDVPMVAITAYHSLRVAEEAIQAGFDAYFPKPLDTTSFVRELRRIAAG